MYRNCVKYLALLGPYSVTQEPCYWAEIRAKLIHKYIYKLPQTIIYQLTLKQCKLKNYQINWYLRWVTLIFKELHMH